MSPPLAGLRILALFALAGFPEARAVEGPARPWNEDVIYFALTDRFSNGDKENDKPLGSDPAIFDAKQSDMTRYHGGDLRGLEVALQSGYFQALGISALWITPPVRNVWYSGYDSPKDKTGYHGYWAQDFLDIDPHLVSRQPLAGGADYPDSRDGRMQHYKDFVTLAHRQGIKVIQDIVCNHAGPVFFYDNNGNGRFDARQREEWIQPFKAHGHYGNAHWAENPQWDQHRTGPTGPLTVLGREVKLNGAFGKLESYGRKGMSSGSLGASNGEEVECDFFGLRDFWTAPDGPLFDDLVNDFVETYAFYVEEIGVDGFRIDTVKHVHHAFWDAFTERLRKRLGPERAARLILFGEIYDGNPEKLGQYTYRTDYPQRKDPCLDAVLDFEYCFAARSYLRTSGRPFGSGRDLEKTMRDLQPRPQGKAARPFYNPMAGLDGLTAAQKIVHFTENHDGLNRFRVKGVSERRNLLANALTLTLPGIPCLYYGTEAGLEDPEGEIGPDGETGRLTFIRGGEKARLDAARATTSFQAIAALNALRHQYPALTAGAFCPLWVDSEGAESDDGVFAFARGGEEGVEPLIIVINASNRERSTGLPGNSMKLVSSDGKPLLRQGEQLERLSLPGLDSAGHSPSPPEVKWVGDQPQVDIRIMPEMVDIYHRR